MQFDISNAKVGIIGLGYVGLPLAIEFGKNRTTIGFDINQNRVKELRDGYDVTMECSDLELSSATQITYTTSLDDLRNCNVYIVTVPTPIDDHKQPNLTPLIEASKALGQVVKLNDVVIYESTVYPGATEEDCIPVIENVSGLKFNKDFFAGYSPERINPGDKERRVTNILKVTSGSTPEVADYVDEIYNTIIKAGTHKAPSIKVAEAAKIIENVQRDVNIALINELHHIFSVLDIDTHEVIQAASTKWNFMKLNPGLVGGHCIGVDPYYLLHKSQISGYVPDLMRTAREINDSVPSFLVNDFVAKLIGARINPVDCKVSIMGFTFKENCPDIRNTKVYDLYKNLITLGFKVNVYDPWACPGDVKDHYNIKINNNLDSAMGTVLIMAVGHDEVVNFVRENEFPYVYDFKGLI